MNIRQAIVQTIFWSLLITLGFYIVFKIWWTTTDMRYLGMFSWFFVLIGSIMLAVSLTRIIFFKIPDFNVWTLSDVKKYSVLKNRIGKKIKLINISYITLFFAIIGFSIPCFLKYLTSYRKEELVLYGQIQKVKVSDIHWYRGPGRSVQFNYEINNKTYMQRLSSDTWDIGDSITIYVSTHNPEIVSWPNEE